MAELGTFDGALAVASAVGQESIELVLRGYRAFIDGDFATIEQMLAPEIEWYPVGGGDGAYADRAGALEAMREAFAALSRSVKSRPLMTGMPIARR